MVHVFAPLWAPFCEDLGVYRSNHSLWLLWS